MRMFGVWNMIMDAIYWIAAIVGIIVLIGLLWVVLPPIFAILLAVCIVTGIVVGVQNIREERRREGDSSVNG